MVYLKENFNKDINTLIPLGFTRVKKYCQFEKKYDNRVETIYYSHRDYPPHGFYIDGISAEIYFYEVEEILKRYLEKYNIQNNYGNSTIHKSFVGIDKVDYTKFKIEIHDEATFNEVAAEVKKIVEYGAMPFFEKYETLTDVANLLATATIEEIVQYIQGGILLPKTVLILREANHPQYFERLKEFYIVLKEYAKQERYASLLKLYEDLFSEDLKKL